MKTYICDLNTDLSSLKSEVSDKIYFLTGEPEGKDPMVPLSLLSALQNCKSKTEYIFTERGEKLNYVVAMLYAIESSKGNDVIIKSSLINIDPKILEQVYKVLNNNPEPSKKVQRKRRTKAEIIADNNDKPSVSKDEQVFSMPLPEDALSEEESDDLDAFMNILESINTELISHMSNIIEAARLSKKENIGFEDAIRKVVGFNGDKVINLIGKKNISKVYDESLKIKD